MTLVEEKQGFSKRLRESLKRQGQTAGAAHVAREFNLRYQGTPVTAQAARKWLTGGALPPQDKVRTLAQWLDVSPQWLQFGEADARGRQSASARQETASYRIDSMVLARKIDQLNESHRRMVYEIALALLRLEGKG